jgi:DNA-binding GntR family transcriptional regulator
MTAENFFRTFSSEAGSNLPKYQHLRAAVVAAIRDGHWKEGEKLPTEEQLVEITGYSLGTIQRAVRTLAEDGTLMRKQGSGTFVARTTSRISEPWHFQFLDDDGETLLPAYPKIIARERTDQRGPWSRFLDNGNDSLLRIDRIINVNDEFMFLSRFFVAGELAALMESKPPKQLDGANFRIVLTNACKMPVTNIQHNVSVTSASRKQAALLLVHRDDPLLRVEIAATAGKVTPLYFQELLCPPTNRKLSLSSFTK